MSYYRVCPSCGNTTEGHNVYVCDTCHRIFCKRCREVICRGPLGLFEDPKCPICQGTHIRIIGRIG